MELTRYGVYVYELKQEKRGQWIDKDELILILDLILDNEDTVLENTHLLLDTLKEEK